MLWVVEKMLIVWPPNAMSLPTRCSLLWSFSVTAIVKCKMQNAKKKQKKNNNNSISHGYHGGVLNHILFVAQMKKLLQVIKIIESSMLSSSSPRGGNEIFPQGSSLEPSWPTQSLHCPRVERPSPVRREGPRWQICGVWDLSFYCFILISPMLLLTNGRTSRTSWPPSLH